MRGWVVAQSWVGQRRGAAKSYKDGGDSCYNQDMRGGMHVNNPITYQCFEHLPSMNHCAWHVALVHP